MSVLVVLKVLVGIFVFSAVLAAIITTDLEGWGWWRR